MTTVAPPSSAFGKQKALSLAWQPLPRMQEYLDQKVAEGKNHDYVRGIRMSLAHFANFCATQNVAYPEQIERAHLVMFQGWANNQGYTVAYAAETLKRVRAWLNWLVDVGYLPTNPWVQIKIRTVRKQPNPLSDDELFDFFARHRRDAFSATAFTYHRRELMLVLLYGWGMRIHELVALNIADMNPSNDFVRAINKGGGVKFLPYSEQMKGSFRRWESWRVRYADRDEEALFIARSGRRMTTNDVWEIVHELGERAGVRINPHRLRDTCGTHMLDDDVPVERVAMILGHTNIKQTLAYSRVNNSKVAESHAKTMDPRLGSLIFGRTKNLKEDR